jgi:iron-sulfur cluster assembly accessory protein
MGENITIDRPKNIVSFTSRAVEQVRSMWADAPEDDGKPLRVYVEKGGCSGMQYGLVFDEVRDGDTRQKFDGVDVLIDAVSAEYLTGTTVDFSDDLMSGGFKLSNPNAKQNCGCGRSFEA